MATQTLKLKLRKPAGVDQVDVITDIADNMQKIDDALPTTVCTSGTRPGSPFTGQTIFETDTERTYIWNGSAWKQLWMESDTILSPVSSSVGFKNKFFNSDFLIDQRKASPVTAGPDPLFIVDRWRIDPGTGGTPSYTVTAEDTRATFDGAIKRLKWTRNVQSTVTGSKINQRVEGLAQFAGKTVTLSVWMHTGGSTLSTTCDITPYITLNFGTGGSPSSPTTIAGTLVQLPNDSTWRKYTYTFTVPSMTGNTFGTDDNDYLEAGWVRSIVITARGDDIYLTLPQIELGSAATDYERKPYALDLNECQRFYYVIKNTVGANRPIGLGQCVNTTSALVTIPVPPQLKRGASIAFSALTHFFIYNASGVGQNTTNITISSGIVEGIDNVRLTVTVASGLVAGNVTNFTTNTTTAQIIFNAEL